MSRSSQVTLPELCAALSRLAVYVREHNQWSPDDSSSLSWGLRNITNNLQRFTPGLDPPANPDVIGHWLRLAEQRLGRGDELGALQCALEGLARAPMNPRLWYIAASAVFELGEVELSMRLLYHTLWINPGYKQARDDLEALTAFFEDNA